jgi:hypothetical protein
MRAGYLAVFALLFVAFTNATILANLTRDWNRIQGGGTITNAGWVFYRYCSGDCAAYTDMTWTVNDRWAVGGVQPWFYNSTNNTVPYYGGMYTSQSTTQRFPAWVFMSNASHSDAWISYRGWGELSASNITIKHNDTTIASTWTATGQNASGFVYLGNLAIGANITLIVSSGVAAADTNVLYDVIISDSLNDSNGVALTVYDELSPTALKQVNVTFSNATASVDVFASYNSLNASISALPTGVVTALFKNASCLTGNILPRTVIYNTTQGGKNFTAYLLCDGSVPISTPFFVKDSIGNSLTGVTLEIQKVINAQLVNISSSITAGGVGTFWLDSSGTYQIVASAPGFLQYTQAVAPISQGYSITLVNATLPSFNTTFGDISYAFGPDYATNGTTLFWFNISSTDNQLLNYGLDLYGNTTTLIGQASGSSVGGGNSTVSANVSLYANLTAVGWFIKAGYARYNLTKTYWPLGGYSGGTSLTEAGQQNQNNPPSNVFTGILSLVIAAMVASWVARYTNTVYAGVAALLTLGFTIMLFNWMSFNIFFLLVLFVASVVYFLRSR